MIAGSFLAAQAICWRSPEWAMFTGMDGDWDDWGLAFAMMIFLRG